MPSLFCRPLSIIIMPPKFDPNAIHIGKIESVFISVTGLSVIVRGVYSNRSEASPTQC